MINCALCSKNVQTFNIKKFNIENLKLNDGNYICTSCALKLNKVDSNMIKKLNEYSLEDVKKLFQSKFNSSTSTFSFKGCLSMVLIFGIFAIFIRACFFGKNDSTDIEKTEKEDNYNKKQREIQVFTYAEICVKENLKSPSSAEFHMMETKIWEINDSTYMVKGPVDSQNAYGAMLRANFECKVIILGDENFRCEDVVIIE